MLTETLYMRDVKGVVRVWQIEADTSAGELIITYGVYGGAMQQHIEFIEAGLAGRTLDEQVMSRMLSRINAQKDKGYRKELQDVTTNMLGLPKPMLAQTYKGKLDFNQRVYMQRKYDGMRCIIANIDGRIVAYSRKGKPINTITHILDSINVPLSWKIDGELYAHNTKLQTIKSWVARKQQATNQVTYRVYDTMEPIPYNERLELLHEIRGNKVELAETIEVYSTDEVKDYFKQFRAENYEGAILRLNNAKYEAGKRSYSLLKLKEWQDSEFIVHDILPSADGWAVLVLKTLQGKEFKVSAPGTIAEKRDVLFRTEYYLGKTVTIEYASLTNDGIPFHPVAKAWRT